MNCYWDGSKSVYIKKQNQQEETDMPTTEWLNKYEAIKDKLTCKDDLEAHFTEKVIGNMAVDVLDIGAVHYVQQKLLAARDAGAAVLLISDDLDEVMLMGDRIAVMHEGHLTVARDASAWTRQSIGLAMAGSAEVAA